MKSRLLYFLIAVCAAFPLAAQFTPQGFNYQSIVRDANGTPVVNQTVTLLFSIRSGAPNGPVAYSEKQTLSTNEYGLVNLVIGQGGTPLQGTFGAINWGGGAKYLTVALETSPNVFDELGSSQLMSVPYALYAQSAANGGTGGDNWGSQTVQTGPALSGNGTTANPLNIAQQGAATGQVLKWDGSKWLPQDDISDTGSSGGTVTQINTGAGLTGGPITTSGTVGLSNTGVAPGIYGSATEIPVITVDAQGRVTDVFKTIVQPGTVGITGTTGITVQQNGFNFVITNTGDTNAADDVTTATQADGDVNGPFSNLQIKPNAVGTAEIANSAVTAAKLNDMGAANGQVLKWNGTAWAPQTDAGITTVGVAAGTGISVTGTSPNFTVTNTGDTNAADDLTTASTANGDVTGPFSNLQLKADVVTTSELANNAVETANITNQAVTAAKLNSMGASNGQVLKWNGTTWAPQNDATGSIDLQQGPGIEIANSGNTYTIINTGDLFSFDDITTASQAGGDLSGPFSNLQIKSFIITNTEMAPNSIGTTNLINGSITGNKLNNMSAGVGNVLKWNGTTWAPAIDETGGGGAGDNWGSQTAATDPTLTGNGTASSPLRIAQQSASNGQVLKWNGTTWIPATDNSGDNWGSQAVWTGSALTGNGTLGSPVNLDQQGATNGQVLKWNGTAWVPGNDSGDNWGSQVTSTDATMTGNGTVGTPLKIAQQGATNGQVLKWNGSTWFPAPDAGDNWGAQAVWTGSALTGNGTLGSPVNLDQQGATPGQVLEWNGTAWVPGNDSGDDWGAQTVNTGVALTGNGTVGSPLNIAQQGATPGQVLRWSGSAWGPSTFSGDDWGAQVASTAGALSGDGTVGNPLNIAQQGAAPGQVLKWNGAAWIPDGDAVGGTGDIYSGGTGITIGGSSPNFVINNAGDLSNTNEIQLLSIAGDQLSLSLGGGTVTLPTANNYSAGTGINITGSAPNFTINNTGDADSNPSNELQTISILGNDISLSNGGGTITLPAGNTYTAGTGISITGAAPNFTVNNTGDADNDPANELQTLSLTGTVLEISGSGSTVDFTSILNNSGAGHWKLDNNNIYNTNSANVLVGTNVNATGKLQVVGGSSEPAGFFTNSSGPALVTGNGNVGIRKATPAFRLDVEGDGRFASSDATPQLIVEQNGGTSAKMNLKNSGAGAWEIAGSGGASGQFSIDFVPTTTAGAIFTANSAGKVGINGVNSGTSSLKVFHKELGFSLENLSNAHSWDFWVSDLTGDLVLFNDQFIPGVPAGTFSATTGLYLPSDRRLKKDIVAIPAGVLGKFMELKPVSYHYTVEKESAKRSLGFLAQDVQGLFPELVSESPARNAEGSYLSLNYAGFGILAVKAIQEQQQQIETLKTENEALRNKMESIEARLKRLEH